MGWDGGVALAEISEILPCDNITFFPASCFLSALVVLVLLADVGFMTFSSHYLLFIIVQCSHDFMTDNQTEAFLHWNLTQCFLIQCSPADSDD